MRRTSFLVALFISLMVFSAFANAWNLDAKHINALSFRSDGAVQFTLFNTGEGGSEMKCENDRVFFKLTTCKLDNQTCYAAVNRMSSLLLAAKMSGKAIHVQRSGCIVSEVVLKP